MKDFASTGVAEFSATVPFARRPVQPDRTVLVVAHPGHELRLFGWLTQVKPDVLVLTDGSGRTGRSRIAATRRVLKETGAREGGLFGRYTDQQIYRGMLDADVPMFIGMASVLTELFQQGRYRVAVADPFEGYNPTHDLCSVLVNVAARCTSLASGHAIKNYEYALTGTLGTGGSAAPMCVRLGPRTQRRKRAAVDAYTELLSEVESAVRKEGERAYDEEVLREVSPKTPCHSPGEVPYYETYGERQCAAGRYDSVIRYRHHFAPIARAISDLMGSERGTARQRGLLWA